MSETVRVAVDAMGGDNAPYEIVKGAIEAVNANSNIKVSLLGKQQDINDILKDMSYPKDSIEVVSCEEVIEMAESPTLAIRKKKNSSIVVGCTMIKNKEVDAFVSAGNTGALLAGGQFVAKPMKGIKRAALAVLMPTKKGLSLLIDCGANMDARTEHLTQFAKMGSIYMENVVGVSNPSVAIVNVGAEEEKGNKLVKDTFPLLKADKTINFIGSIEAREIPAGGADVIVCDAFTGNVILKLYEGMAKTILSLMKDGFKTNIVSKIGALLSQNAIKNKLKVFDTKEHGGAPLLGLEGLVVKTHGNATAIEVKNSIIQCELFKKQRISEKIKNGLLRED